MITGSDNWDIHKLVEILALSDFLHAWQIKINGINGYHTAEETLGGVDTDELSSKTVASKKQSGLLFTGEVIDVIHWFGGYNCQFCSGSGYGSGYGCGQAV